MTQFVSKDTSWDESESAVWCHLSFFISPRAPRFFMVFLYVTSINRQGKRVRARNCTLTHMWEVQREDDPFFVFSCTYSYVWRDAWTIACKRTERVKRGSSMYVDVIRASVEAHLLMHGWRYILMVHTSYFDNIDAQITSCIWSMYVDVMCSSVEAHLFMIALCVHLLKHIYSW